MISDPSVLLEDMIRDRSGKLLSYVANGRWDHCDRCRTVWPSGMTTYQPGPDAYVCPLDLD